MGLGRFSSNVKGATIIETVIVLPLFLAGILILIWLGVTLNTTTSINSAVANAVRLATSRGKKDVIGGKPAIQSIEDWYDGGPMPEVLLKPGPDDIPQAMMDFIDSRTDSIFDSANSIYQGRVGLRKLPIQHAYAIAYANHAILLSVGSGVRYPCDPHNKNGLDPSDGAGCLSCYILNPIDVSATPYIGDQATWPLLEKRIALRCDFQPAHFLIAPINSLLSVFSNTSEKTRIVISRTSYFDSVGEGV